MKFLSTIRNNKAELLLASLILLLLLSPVVAELGVNRVFLALLSIPVVLFAAFYASVSKWQSATAIFIAVTWLGLSFLVPGMADTGWPLIIYGLLLAFVTFTLFGHIFRATKVDRSLIASAITVYLLLGTIWGDAYLTIFIINPGAFDAPGVDPDYASVDFLYYSYVTLTTLGYGDIRPISPIARMLSATEAITGVLYTAILIARLVSLIGHDLRKP